MLQSKDFEKNISEIKSWFSQTGYPQKNIETETSKVKFSGQSVFQKAKIKNVVPIVLNYLPLLKTIGKIIHDDFYLLHMNKELRHPFTPGLMVSFRSSRIISSYLVKAKLYPVEMPVGYFNYKRPRCQICIYVNETNRFTSTITGET